MRRLLLALCIAALAVPAVAADKYAVNDDKPLDAARRPARGKSLIYFVRTQTLGMAIKVKLYADGRFVGLIMSKTFIPVEVDPGRHEFIVAAENAGFLEAETAPDKIYVVQTSIHMGAMKARTHFEVARPGSEAMDEYLHKRADLHAITTTDTGLAWARDEDPQIQETIKKFRDKGEEFEHLKPQDGFDALPTSK